MMEVMKMKQTVSGNTNVFDISCSNEDIEKSMNKPIGITTADIYLRFPEIMEEETNDLADFLEEEHIVYEGATDVFMEKDKEIERLNNIINELKKDLITIRQKTFTKYHANEWDNCLSFNEDIKPMLDKLKELKESEK